MTIQELLETEWGYIAAHPDEPSAGLPQCDGYVYADEGCVDVCYMNSPLDVDPSIGKLIAMLPQLIIAVRAADMLLRCNKSQMQLCPGCGKLAEIVYDAHGKVVAIVGGQSA